MQLRRVGTQTTVKIVVDSADHANQVIRHWNKLRTKEEETWRKEDLPDLIRFIS